MHSISSTLNKKHNSIWVQNKSVLILQITACKKKKCQSNIHSIVSSSFSLNAISFSWMCANYCCSWCFVIFMLFVIICFSEDKTLTAGRFHMSHICCKFIFACRFSTWYLRLYIVGIRRVVLCLCCTWIQPLQMFFSVWM